MSTSVVFPPRAAPALGLLKSGKNDIEIFVENSVGNNVWTNLLRTYLPSGVKLESVNLLGSRDDVLNACKLDQKDDGRRKLYIIDADFDLLRGIRKRSLKHLYRLRGYCLENYLIDFDAIIVAVTLVHTEATLSDVRSEKELIDWMKRNRKALAMLFICYAVVIELMPEKRTIGFSVRNLLNNGAHKFDLCERRVRVRIIELYRAVLKNCGNSVTRQVYERVQANAQKWKVEMFVSGKDYVLPVIYDLVRSRYQVRLKPIQFQTLIAGCVSNAHDRFLQRRLYQICS